MLLSAKAIFLFDACDATIVIIYQSSIEMLISYSKKFRKIVMRRGLE